MNTLRASKGITSSGKTFWLIPAMRKKGRNGPGIATFADSGDPTLASSNDKESEGGAKHEPTDRVAARMAARRKRDLAHRFVSKSFRRSVRVLIISSPKRNRA